MGEQYYSIFDGDGKLLAEKMTFEMVIVFIRGFKDTFYNESLILTIKEMDKTCQVVEEVTYGI